MPVHCAPREGGALRSRGVAQSGSAPALGAGCRGFESLHPDHYLSSLPQRGVSLRVCCLNARQLLDGGCSSPGRAPDCGSGGSGFETRQPPHFVRHPLCLHGSSCPSGSLTLVLASNCSKQCLIVERAPACRRYDKGENSVVGKKKGGVPCPRVSVSGLGR